LYASGFSFRVESGNRLFLRPAERVTAAHRAYVDQHRPQLLAALTDTKSVVIGHRSFPYLPRWTGQVLIPIEGYLAFDTETDADSDDPDRGIQTLALAQASAGEQASLIHPDDLARFILTHENLHWVGHHAAFDFWTTERHLRERNEQAALAAWWRIADEGRLHDSMLLDMLLRLAKDDSFPDPRRLDEVARDYADLVITKDDPYRLRYGEIIGKDWATIDPGFWEYAIKDVLATRAAYVVIRQQAEQVVADFPGSEILPGAVEKFGLLTEAVQVKKAIALAAIQHRGIGVDLGWVQQGETELRRHLDESVAQVRASCPDLYKTNKDGSLKISATGKPRRNDKVLRDYLVEVVRELQDDESGVEVRVPLTKKTRLLSLSTKFWHEYADHSVFLKHWCDTEEFAKLLQFYVNLKEPRAHPKYTTMVRSGRTSAHSPNIQQIPRDSDFRQAFVPSSGHFLLAIDYSYIELVTLAAVCEHRYGRSRLGEVIRAGVDPHANTAAAILGKELAEFVGWKDNPTEVDDRTLADHFKQARQKAKPINFGVPGSLGVRSLRTYAKASYGVVLTEEEARAWRDKLIHEIYPELGPYLDEDAPLLVARNLGVPVEQARAALGDVHPTCVRKVIAGEPRKQTGEPYKPDFVAKVWNVLLRAAQGSALLPALEARRAEGDTGPDDETREQRTARKKCHEELARRVCQSGVATLTGRIRGRVRYSQARNTPFQGLAADGAALALFAQVKQGDVPCGFIHDEVLQDVRDEGGYVSETVVRQRERVQREGMALVLGCDIPVSVESALSTCWSKQATLLVEDGRVYPWKPLAVFLDELRREGFAPHVESKQLRLAPDKVLTVGQRLLLRTHEKKLIEFLTVEPAEPPADEAAAYSPVANPGAVVPPEPAAADEVPSAGASGTPGIVAVRSEPVVITLPASAPPVSLVEPVTKPRRSRQAKSEAYKFPGVPFKWFGGKGGHHGELAKWVVSQMVPHKVYVEPYCGTCAVLLARDPKDRRLWVADTKDDRGVAEYANDLHRGLSNFLQVLRSESGDELIARLQGYGLDEWVWKGIKARWEGPLDADPATLAEWWYILCRQSYDGNCKQFAGGMSDRTRGGKAENLNAWQSAVHKTLPAVRERLLDVVIRCMPALDCIRAYDALWTLFYIDPPYWHAARTSADDYLHEMTDQDHAALLTLLRSVKGKVVLSGYRNELYDTMLSDWCRLEMPTKVQTGSAEKKSARVEVLWLNYEPPGR
jgi:DNA adenine methylase